MNPILSRQLGSKVATSPELKLPCKIIFVLFVSGNKRDFLSYVIYIAKMCNVRTCMHVLGGEVDWTAKGGLDKSTLQWHAGINCRRNGRTTLHCRNKSTLKTAKRCQTIFLSNKILTDYKCIYLLCTFPQWKTPFVVQTFFCFFFNRWIFLFSFESWKGLRFQSGPKRGARRELVVSIPQLLGEVSFRCREGGGVTLQLSSAEWALCEQTCRLRAFLLDHSFKQLLMG